jgi:hypothetical protein
MNWRACIVPGWSKLAKLHLVIHHPRVQMNGCKVTDGAVANSKLLCLLADQSNCAVACLWPAVAIKWLCFVCPAGSAVGVLLELKARHRCLYRHTLLSTCCQCDQSWLLRFFTIGLNIFACQSSQRKVSCCSSRGSIFRV